VISSITQERGEGDVLQPPLLELPEINLTFEFRKKGNPHHVLMTMIYDLTKFQ